MSLTARHLLTIALLILQISASSRPVSRRAPLPSEAAVHYRVDARRSQLIVRAFVGGLLSPFGHNHTIAARDLSGDVQIADPESLRGASLTIVVRAASLTVIDKVSESDRRQIEQTMRAEVLETSKYPEIVFHSTEVQAQKVGDGQYRIRIAGDLSLHGVTRPLVINALASFDGETLHARGEFTLRQSDYKITPPSLGLGTIRVKDELKLSFDITATRAG